MEKLNLEEFGKRIIYLREIHGKSQEEICSELGVTQQTLSRYEKGQRQANLDFVVRAAKYFNVSADYLLCLSDTPSIDENIQMICESTGLCETAIDNLKFIKKNLFNTSNLLISNGIFVEIAQRLYNYIVQCAKIRYYENIQKKIDSYFNIENIQHKDLEKKSEYIEALGIALGCVGCGTAKKYNVDIKDGQRDLAEYRLFNAIFKTIEIFKHNTDLDDVLSKELKDKSGTNLSNAIMRNKESGNKKIANILEDLQKKLKLYPLYYYDQVTVEEYEKMTGRKLPNSYPPDAVVRMRKEREENAHNNPQEE